MTPADALPEGYALREVRVDDAEALAAAYDRNRGHLERWDPLRSPDFYTADWQRDALERQLSLVDAGLAGGWVVTHGDDVVGRVNLNNVVRGVMQGGALGYWVDTAHTRRGLATALVEHACTGAGQLGLHRIEASTMIANTASQNVLLRCGFAHYGTAPKFLFIAGAWQDHHLYQRLLHDEDLPVLT